MRRTLGLLVAATALVAAMALPAETAVRPDASPRRDPSRCYGHHSQNRSDYCTDERRPQHDGRGSILF
jgi:hypothetical protein